MEFARANCDREQLLLASDRERIGRDLPDLVIQRLFGTGMGLQGILGLIDNERAAERVAIAVDDLDATIREIRTTIFQLETPKSAASGLRTEMLHLIDEAGEGLDFEPNVHFDGPVDSAPTDELKAGVLAVAREALSNIARHAHASQAEVDLRVGEEVALVVSDECRREGIGASKWLGQHPHPRREARRDLAPDEPPEGGARLEWRVPVHQPQASG